LHARLESPYLFVVEITVDEAGAVVEPSAISGPLLLKDAADSAARHDSFKSTTLSGVGDR